MSKTSTTASTLLRASLLVSVAAVSGDALGANLLTDPGFESNAVTSAFNSLNDFPTYQGVWGQENSTIVGVDGGVVPASGLRQLRMDISGGVTTQAFQTVDVTSFAGLIDSNNAILNASALFNSNAQAALGGVYIQYFTGNSYGTNFGPLDTSIQTFDASPMTWQSASLSVPIPANTRWIIFQVAFAEATLMDATGVVGSGYVDDAFMEIVPTPGSGALLAIAGLAGLRRRRA